METKLTEQEIQDQIDYANDNRNAFSGMTYAEGVAAALEWVLFGNSDEKPMEN